MRLWATAMERGVLLRNLINPPVSVDGIYHADITFFGRSIHSIVLNFAMPDLRAEDSCLLVGQALVQLSYLLEGTSARCTTPSIVPS